MQSIFRIPSVSKMPSIVSFFFLIQTVMVELNWIAKEVHKFSRTFLHFLYQLALIQIFHLSADGPFEDESRKFLYRAIERRPRRR